MTTALRLFVSISLAAAATSSFGACVVSPLHDELHSAATDPISISTYATAAGAEITIECGKPSHNTAWVHVGTLTASTSATTIGGESVYAARGDITLPVSCWDTGWAGATYTTYMQFKQNDDAMFVYDEAGFNCLIDGISVGDGAITTGYECALVNPYTGEKQHYIALRANSF